MTEGLYDAVLAALETVPQLPRDVVATQLALRYAERLDGLFELSMDAPVPEDGGPADGAERARVTLEITRMGARLEAMLDRLGMAPSARPLVPTGGNGGTSPEADQLDALSRDAAAGAPSSGIDYAAGVDPSVTAADAAD